MSSFYELLTRPQFERCPTNLAYAGAFLYATATVQDDVKASSLALLIFSGVFAL